VGSVGNVQSVPEQASRVSVKHNGSGFGVQAKGSGPTRNYSNSSNIDNERKTEVAGAVQ